ncbi:hypothetical protein HOP52_13155 [Halomonas campisalis]|uniref:MFS transporter n=1 Tax=Billgrantia campisalis TaxID=74661 RepID=A0ABS9PBS5_9GAMM|nr:hypothetical protein [Halomonas campisalis]MCG6658702.1 hypothetical protein [Halomonas campisalis]MDR5864033.1 hypothetical protein [Halomonas campisalis]
MQEFFTWLGATLGEIIRFVVDLLIQLFRNLGDAAEGFLDGLAESLGISPSLISLLVLLLGLWLLYLALRALLRRRLIGGLIWALLGVTVLSWLIN